MKGLVIAGPTGVGKTDLSLKLAEKLKTELHQQSDYYADHRVDNSRALNMVAAPGARLKTRMPTLTIIVTVIIVIYYGLQFLGIFS